MAIPLRKELDSLKEARRRLATTNDLDQIKLIRADAELIGLGAKVRATDPRVLRLAAELKLLAERKLGKLLAAMALRGGDRTSSRFDHSALSRLQILGVSCEQSSRWQLAASVPEDRFRQYLRDAANEAHLPTSIGLRRLAKACQVRDQGAPYAELAEALRSLAGRNKTFACIYADPPGEEHSSKHFRSLTNLPVAQIAARNAHLHLWITPEALADGLRLLRAWGFRYASSRVWITTPGGGGNLQRAHCFLLLGVRGQLPFLDNSLKSVVTGRRSIKPDAGRRMIERVSPGPRLDLFGTKPLAGWTLAMGGRRRAQRS